MTETATVALDYSKNIGSSLAPHMHAALLKNPSEASRALRACGLLWLDWVGTKLFVKADLVFYIV